LAGQRPLIERRAESRSRAPPEGELGKHLLPPRLPASDGPPGDIEESVEFLKALGSGPLAHGGQEDDQHLQVHLRSQETHRRWCRSASTAIGAAGEAESTPELRGQVHRAASGLSGIVPTMESPSTEWAALVSDLPGEVAVGEEKERPKPGVLQNGMAQ